MREIKFRAWDIDSKQMMMPNEVIEVLVSMKDNVYAMVMGRVETTGKIKRDNTVIMQYTGLKDNNGEDIYEGDIIWDAHAEIYGRVNFDDGSFYVEWRTHSELLFEVVVDGYAEISGNVYENPELI